VTNLPGWWDRQEKSRRREQIMLEKNENPATGLQENAKKSEGSPLRSVERFPNGEGGSGNGEVLTCGKRKRLFSVRRTREEWKVQTHKERPKEKSRENIRGWLNGG